MYKSNNPIIKGTLILTISGIITRLISFYNRIFLSRLIGTKELGIYQLTFPIYMFAFSLCNQGISLALTKLLSEHISRKDYGLAKSTLRVALLLSCSLGIISTIFIYNLAPCIATHILKSSMCTKSLRVICLGIPFVCIKGCINGYFLSIKKVQVNGMSQLIEQIFRVLSIYLLYSYVTDLTPNAHLATMGIFCGEVISGIFVIICYLFNPISSSMKNSTYTKAFTSLLSEATPLTMNKTALTLLQSVESILIPSMLMLYYNNSDTSLSMFGTLTGIVLPFIMFPNTLTGALSTILLPTISAANAVTDQSSISKITNKSITFCLIIGLLSSGLFLTFGRELGEIIFNSSESGTMLLYMAFLCPFIYTSSSLSSIINGLGKATTNLLYSIIAISIRLGFILFAIPVMGLSGYIIGLYISYALLIILLYTTSKKYTHSSIAIGKKIDWILPTIIAVTSSLSIKFLYNTVLLKCIHNSYLSLGTSLIIQGIIYLAILIVTIRL